jgi:5-methyltetrahydrofolate--homocysteine methyltransferase
MNTLMTRLKQKKVMVSDGAWGTMLQKKGLQPGECPELWCLERPADVRAVAADYAAAGAELIKTNSFGGTRFKLDFFGLADRAAALNEAAAALSREAAGPDRFVLGSMGPTGKMLLMGDVTEEELYQAFREQAVALEKGGADAALIETFAALDEAGLAIKAVKENTRLVVACTFTFERSVSGEFRSMMGVSPTDMAAACLEAGADILGSNCGNGFAQMVAIVRELRRAAPGAPILVHANAGMPVNRDGVDFFPETPETSASLIPAIVQAGAAIVGGCCGTTPAHIAAIARAVRELD